MPDARMAMTDLCNTQHLFRVEPFVHLNYLLRYACLNFQYDNIPPCRVISTGAYDVQRAFPGMLSFCLVFDITRIQVGISDVLPWSEPSVEGLSSRLDESTLMK